MKTTLLRPILLVILGLLLSGCFTKNTPDDVAKAFWNAVLEGDADTAVKYSTLTDAKAYDGFSKDWTGYEPSWGKIVIEGEKASVNVRFINPNTDDTEGRRITTYLIMKDGKWKVDYARTKNEVQGGVFGQLFGKLSELGDDIAQEFNSSKEEFKSDMERMGQELESLSEDISREASENLEKIAKDMQEALDELAKEAQKALEDDKNLTDEDKRQLNRVIDDLEKSHDQLDEPSTESISEGSRSMARAQREMIILDKEEMEKYQEKWRKMEQEMEQEIQKFLDEFTSGDEQVNQTQI